MKMKLKFKRLTKIIAFILIFVILFSNIQNVLVSRSATNYQIIYNFYREREDSLDAVYIGSSNCFVFWNSALAFKEYGISIFPYACNSQPFAAAEGIIKEVRKTQRNAKFIVNINSFVNEALTMERLHNLLDCMPLSINKLLLTKRLCDLGGYEFWDSLEFYFPIIRYHDRWDSLKTDDFEYELNNLKGASLYEPYLNRSDNNVAKKYVTSNETAKLSEQSLNIINHLLDYCDKEKIDITFVTVPQSRGNVEQVKKYNALNKLINERGYDTLDMLNNSQEYGIIPSKDFYNNHHTNIHGSIKFTHKLSEYLIEKYGFKDKRNDKSYADWVATEQEYSKEIAPYVLNFELDSNHRNFKLAAPEQLKTSKLQNAAFISWQEVDGAKGYKIFRKTDKTGAWQEIGETETTSYTDAKLTAKSVYFYTVVPFSETNGEKYYGDFNYQGIRINL